MSASWRVMALVPARKGSKGLPGKNVRPMHGRPMVAYTFDAAMQARSVTRVVVSTDCPDVMAAARACDLDVLVRPAELAADDTPMVPVMVHALEWAEARAGHQFDALALLQPTAPLRLAEDVDGAVELLRTSGAPCVVTVTQSREHPMRAKRIENGVLVPFSVAEPSGGLRQSLPASYRRNGAVYVFTREAVLTPDPVRGPGVRPYMMPADRSIDIDGLVEFRVAEQILAERLGVLDGA